MVGHQRPDVFLRRTFLFLFLTFAFLGKPESSLGARVVISCGSMGKELDACRSGAEVWAKKTQNEVEIFSSPVSSGERLGQMQLLLAAKSPDIDVFLIDTPWPAILSPFFVDLGADKRVRQEAPLHFPEFIKNNTVDERLIALPWFIDGGLLYYRKDLLAKYQETPPETWKDLQRIALKIQGSERKKGNHRFWGYVFQGRAYEGLTCNGLEWVESWGGGSIVAPDGTITIQNPQANQALKTAASWIGTISPRGVLNYMEEESRGVFQSGNAAFLRSWPYVWKLSNSPDSPIRGQVGMTVLPRGEGPNSKHASTLGGWSLAVSRYSKNIPESIELVRYLTGVEEQKRRVFLLGQNPTYPKLYEDPELVRENPHFPILLRIFDQAISRPSKATGSRYNRVSSEFWNSLHDILSGTMTPEETFRDLSKTLWVISKGGKW